MSTALSSSADAPDRAVDHRRPMTYLMTSNTPGDLDTFRAVCDLIDAHATGLIARYAGENENGLAITAIWESKAACDRFTVEHLHPTLASLAGDRGPAAGPSVFVAFESVEQRVTGLHASPSSTAQER